MELFVFLCFSLSRIMRRFQQLQPHKVWMIWCKKMATMSVWIWNHRQAQQHFKWEQIVHQHVIRIQNKAGLQWHHKKSPIGSIDDRGSYSHPHFWFLTSFIGLLFTTCKLFDPLFIYNLDMFWITNLALDFSTFFSTILLRHF